MLHILSDQEGVISVLSYEGITGASVCDSNLPPDLFLMVGLGKYRFLNGQIIAVPGWEMPEPELLGPQ
jgi:hypothetical protein